MIKIAVIGPESTGKSTLCEALSKHYNISYVKEFSREFLNQLGRPYNYEDLISIGEGQSKLISDKLRMSKELLISDTELMTLKIWSEIKYGKTASEINLMLDEQFFDLYLLCNTDLPWEYDLLREVPNEEKRKDIFTLFKSILESRNCNFKVISGRNNERTNMAIDHINSLINR